MCVCVCVCARARARGSHTRAQTHTHTCLFLWEHLAYVSGRDRSRILDERISADIALCYQINELMSHFQQD